MTRHSSYAVWPGMWEWDWYLQNTGTARSAGTGIGFTLRTMGMGIQEYGNANDYLKHTLPIPP